MAKAKNKDNVIALEIEKFEAKINEFQAYLRDNNIVDMTGLDERFKEIDLQTKMMNALPNWLMSLKNLKEAADSVKVEIRGSGETNKSYELLTRKD